MILFAIFFSFIYDVNVLKKMIHKEKKMEVFDFDDVQLIPRKCIIASRREADTQFSLGHYSFKIPVIPANMSSVIDEKLAIWLAQHQYFYVMHRFNPETRFDFIKKMHQQHLIASISVGVQQNDYDFIQHCARENEQPEFITIDIAHGHSNAVMDMIQYIKRYLPNTFVIAGNIATPEAVIDLEQAGADATKIGIGPGKACITRDKTGFGTRGWQLSAIKWCAEAAHKPIIADGGIRCNGDIAKAIRFGATAVMIGSMLAGHDENPGELFTNENGEQVKKFFGSASKEQKQTLHHIEGKSLTVSYKGSIEHTLTEIQEDIQSAISYAGGKTLNDLKCVDYVIIKS